MAPPANYVIHENKYNMDYYLADGIYFGEEHIETSNTVEL